MTITLGRGRAKSRLLQPRQCHQKTQPDHFCHKFRPLPPIPLRGVGSTSRRPKPDCFLMSHYRYQRRNISIQPNGSIHGGLSRFVSSLIDFSFIRSLVAHRYHLIGRAYDPVSIFLPELFRSLEKFSDMKAFLSVLHDPHRGMHYRLYALRGVGPTGRRPESMTDT